MTEQLDSLIQMIENHFNKMIWNNLQPFKNLDYQLILLSQKIVEVKNEINSANVDNLINQLMKYIEQEFKFTLCEETIEAESKRDEVRHKLILEINSKLLQLKSNKI